MGIPFSIKPIHLCQAAQPCAASDPRPHCCLRSVSGLGLKGS